MCAYVLFVNGMYGVCMLYGNLCELYCGVCGVDMCVICVYSLWVVFVYICMCVISVCFVCSVK